MIQRLAVLTLAASFSFSTSTADMIVRDGSVASRPVAGEFNPVGTYNLEITAQGNAMTVQAVVEKKEDGTFGGTLTGDAFPPLTIKSVAVADRNVKLTVIAPDGGDALVDITVDENNDVAGQWSMTGDGSKVTGKKIA